MTQVRLRPLAEQDLVEQTQYYLAEAGADLAKRFFDTAVETLKTAGDRPAGGSLRIGELCGIDSLRVRKISGVPTGWFYFIRPEFVDEVRLLGFAQDLPSELAVVRGEVVPDD